MSLTRITPPEVGEAQARLGDLSQAKGPEKAQPQDMITQDGCSAGLDSCPSPQVGVA